MKLEARQIAGFLRDPGAARMALIYGEDEGLIRERAQALTRCIAGSLDDAFLVTELTREGWGRLPAEMAALSMIGGRRVVLVRDATDAILPHVTQALGTPGTAMLILEAAGLAKGRLRSFAESSAEGVALPCYVEEGRARAQSIRGLLAEYRIDTEEDTVAWLAEHLEPGRAVVRGEIEKLVLFVGPGGRVTLDSALACIGGQAAGAGEDGIMAAVMGNRGAADGAVETALADGLGGIGVLRMALTLLQRLHQAKLHVAAGAAPNDVVRMMRPPVFFRAVPAMVSVLELWTADGLLRAIDEVRRVELDCKQTGSRPDLLARRFVADLARMARLQRGRASVLDAG